MENEALGMKAKLLFNALKSRGALDDEKKYIESISSLTPVYQKALINDSKATKDVAIVSLLHLCADLQSRYLESVTLLQESVDLLAETASNLIDAQDQSGLE